MMKIPRVVDSRLGYLSAALFMLVGVVAPAALTASASAAQITSRSMQLSSSAADASSVSYTLKFTPTTAAGATVVEFCSDSPLVGESCAAPGGFTVASVATTTGTAAEFESHVNVLLWTNSLTTGSANTVEFTGIHNPTATGPLYARLITYTDATAAGTAYTSSTSIGAHGDDGGIAMSITNPINVSAAVLETMTFCVSGAALSAHCSGATTPDLELGTGSPLALEPGTPSTGDIFTQVSTNAVGGAVVKMKASNTCGGLHRQGAVSTLCDIPAVATGTNVIDGTAAMFGLKVDNTNVTPTTNYAGSNYGLNYVSGGASGVTNAYGDEIYNTAGAAVDSADATLTFAAAATATTPAGKYTAALNLIATGTF